MSTPVMTYSSWTESPSCQPTMMMAPFQQTCARLHYCQHTAWVWMPIHTIGEPLPPHPQTGVATFQKHTSVTAKLRQKRQVFGTTSSEFSSQPKWLPSTKYFHAHAQRSLSLQTTSCAKHGEAQHNFSASCWLFNLSETTLQMALTWLH
jgi:hypothetical protein